MMAIEILVNGSLLAFHQKIRLQVIFGNKLLNIPAEPAKLGERT